MLWEDGTSTHGLAPTAWEARPQLKHLHPRLASGVEVREGPLSSSDSLPVGQLHAVTQPTTDQAALQTAPGPVA